MKVYIVVLYHVHHGALSVDSVWYTREDAQRSKPRYTWFCPYECLADENGYFYGILEEVVQ